MYTTIGPEALGIRGLSLTEAIDLARQSGFAGLAFDARAVADAVDARGVEAVREEFSRAGVRPAFFNLPVAWRDEERWQADLDELPRLANAARAIGADRTVTYILSGSDDLPYDENLAWHVARLRPIAEVLRAVGCRFGLEYVGTTSFRERFRYPFIFTLDGVQDLIAAIAAWTTSVSCSTRGTSSPPVARWTISIAYAIRTSSSLTSTTRRPELPGTSRSIPCARCLWKPE